MSSGETMLLLRDRISELLLYEPDTGLFRWRRSRNGYCGGVKPGDVAGTPRDGYVQINVDQRVYRAHRLAWLLQTGSFPARGFEIDHRNRNRADNRWSNLRLATRSQNNMNAGLRRNNRSGCRGVSQTRAGRWDARITVAGETRLLGEFCHKNEAIAVRRAAEARLFGEFAAHEGALQ